MSQTYSPRSVSAWRAACHSKPCAREWRACAALSVGCRSCRPSHSRRSSILRIRRTRCASRWRPRADSTRGRVIVVFGCAGLRDVSKRALMGEVAGKLADQIVVTAEDPRTESLEEINRQIEEGLQRAGRRKQVDYSLVDDRAEAIQRAVNMARAGDLVIVTGKGHERSMCFGTTEYPWSDQDALRAALETPKRRGSPCGCPVRRTSCPLLLTFSSHGARTSEEVQEIARADATNPRRLLP